MRFYASRAGFVFERETDMTRERWVTSWWWVAMILVGPVITAVAVFKR